MQWIYTKNVNGFTFVAATFPLNKPDSILIENLKLQQLIEYIERKQIKKAFIQKMCNFDFLRSCPGLEHISIELECPFCEYKNAIMKDNKIYKEYDFQPLFSLSCLKSLNIINNERPDIQAKIQIDISKLKCLEMYYGEYSFITSINEAISLRTLILSKFPNSDLTALSRLRRLDSIKFTFSKMHTLKGIDAFDNLQCLYLSYNRSLSDISALRKVKGTLKALRIENCPKIEDFSVLCELENLELLELSGSNVLPSLDFLKTMKNLKLFMFSMNVLNGDLSPCLDISCVDSFNNRKHYNLKDKDLPKGNFVMGNESIEEWRRLE